MVDFKNAEIEELLAACEEAPEHNPKQKLRRPCITVNEVLRLYRVDDGGRYWQ